MRVWGHSLVVCIRALFFLWSYYYKGVQGVHHVRVEARACDAQEAQVDDGKWLH